MHERGICYGFSISELLNCSWNRRAKVLGRMKQNFRLCRKYRVPIFVASFATTLFEMRGPYEVRALLSMLGKK
jgi:RNase P/RNase MRP subunit p30